MTGLAGLYIPKKAKTLRQLLMRFTNFRAGESHVIYKQMP